MTPRNVFRYGDLEIYFESEVADPEREILVLEDDE